MADTIAPRSGGITDALNLANLFLGSNQSSGGTSTVGGGTSVQTTQDTVSQDAINAQIQSILSGTQGLAAVSSGQKAAGLYNSSTNSLLTNDLLARAAAQGASLNKSSTVTKTTPTTTNTTAGSQAVAPKINPLTALGVTAGWNALPASVKGQIQGALGLDTGKLAAASGGASDTQTQSLIEAAYKDPSRSLDIAGGGGTIGAAGTSIGSDVGSSSAGALSGGYGEDFSGLGSAAVDNTVDAIGSSGADEAVGTAIGSIGDAVSSSGIGDAVSSAADSAGSWFSDLGSSIGSIFGFADGGPVGVQSQAQVTPRVSNTSAAVVRARPYADGGYVNNFGGNWGGTSLPDAVNRVVGMTNGPVNPQSFRGYADGGPIEMSRDQFFNASGPKAQAGAAADANEQANIDLKAKADYIKQIQTEALDSYKLLDKHVRAGASQSVIDSILSKLSPGQIQGVQAIADMFSTARKPAAERGSPAVTRAREAKAMNDSGFADGGAVSTKGKDRPMAYADGGLTSKSPAKSPASSPVPVDLVSAIVPGSADGLPEYGDDDSSGTNSNNVADGFGLGGKEAVGIGLTGLGLAGFGPAAALLGAMFGVPNVVSQVVSNVSSTFGAPVGTKGDDANAVAAAATAAQQDSDPSLNGSPGDSPDPDGGFGPDAGLGSTVSSGSDGGSSGTSGAPSGDAGTSADGSYASGGAVRGPGTVISDSIPARLSDGEFVMSADVVDAIGVDTLQAIQDMFHTPAAEQRRRA